MRNIVIDLLCTGLGVLIGWHVRKLVMSFRLHRAFYKNVYQAPSYWRWLWRRTP